MNIREIVELAGVVAEHGPVLIRGPARIAPEALNRYWLASKNRLDAWNRALKRLSQRPSAAGTPRDDQEVAALVPEILAAEVLTRVWTSVLAGHDRRRGDGDVEPIARSVFQGQLEVRSRALGIIVHAPGVRLPTAVSLNRLRQRAERWSDLLVGRQATECDTCEFAHDPARAREFADDLKRHARQSAGEHAWAILLGSLRAAFSELSNGTAPHAALNDRVAATILGCFPPELFDGTGVFRSLWLARFSHAAADAQGMIAELMGEDDRPTDSPEFRGRIIRPRR